MVATARVVTGYLACLILTFRHTKPELNGWKQGIYFNPTMYLCLHPTRSRACVLLQFSSISKTKNTPQPAIKWLPTEKKVKGGGEKRNRRNARTVTAITTLCQTVRLRWIGMTHPSLWRRRYVSTLSVRCVCACARSLRNCSPLLEACARKDNLKFCT